MKVNVRTVKNVSPNKNMFKKVVAIILSIVVIIGSYIMIENAVEDTKNTVSVIKVKKTDGLPMDYVVTEKDIEVYELIRTEYTKDMILTEDLDSVVGKYTKYYLRQGSILYKDQFGEERPIINEWLYELGEDEEVVTIPYNYLKCGGDILMPGDRIRIRATYEVSGASGGTDSTSWYGDDPNVIQYQSKNATKKTQIIFDSIVIKDMLNEKSHSIYEIYKEVLRLDEAKRQEVIRSEDFLRSVLPKALVLAGTKEQINEYAKYANLKEGELLITILSREQSNPIIDQFPNITSEVQTWLEAVEE